MANQRCAALSEQILEVNEAICGACPLDAAAAAMLSAATVAQQAGYDHVHAEFTTEGGSSADLAARSLSSADEALDAVEPGSGVAMIQLGRSSLQQLLVADTE